MASVGGVPVALTARLCGEPFAGGDGIGIRVCCVPLSREGSDGVNVLDKGDKPTLGVVEALDFLGLFGDAFATGGVASRTGDSCGESNALISIFSKSNESLSYALQRELETPLSTGDPAWGRLPILWLADRAVLLLSRLWVGFGCALSFQQTGTTAADRRCFQISLVSLQITLCQFGMMVAAPCVDQYWILPRLDLRILRTMYECKQNPVAAVTTVHSRDGGQL